MKTLLQYLFLIFVLPLANAYAAGDRFTIDPSHSYVQWRISHFGFSSPSGKWYVNGTIDLDENNPSASQVNATINLNEIITGIPKLDEHLKGSDFFDVAKYPEASFKSNKIELTSKETAKIYGTLNVHGVSKPLVLNAKLNKLGVSPITHKKTAGFTATASLNRSDFGINAYLPNLGDTIKLDIEVEAYKA